ncbi:hypothetical protein D3G39_25650 [Escherichia coli]|nr:hypothetical protein [Escherichia coli]EFN9649399.1 hypothetical protein [Escherichia coli]EFN9723516.1 hypothetical protein [Escherichia coli]EFN9733679.1 hypothetical protein [Escherichia coli]EFN9743415.1 hypothetical protein [Escherichia coli]
MNFTKHALTIGLIALSFNALAAKSTVNVATDSVDTSFIIQDDCAISVTAQSPKTFTLGEVKNQVRAADITITPTCGGKYLWAEMKEVDSQGYGIARTDTGDLASITWVQDGNWDSGEGERVAKTTKQTVASQGVPYPAVFVNEGDYGLPKKAGEYKFGLTVGYWVE